MVHTDMSHRLAYPEIEAAPVYDELPLWRQELAREPLTTQVDLLEIPRMPEAKVLWKTGLDHDSLVEHFEGLGSSHTIVGPALRVLFVDAVRSTSYNLEIAAANRGVLHSRLHLSTINWMRDRFVLSPIFVNLLMIGITMDTRGGSSFLKKDNKGDVVGITGFYTIYGTPCQVWFSHNFQPRTSTYIVIGCFEHAKSLILKCALGDSASSLGRICAIDAFIVDAYAKEEKQNIIAPTRSLFEYERICIGLEHHSPREMSAVVEGLHHISKSLHIFAEKLADVEAHLAFLCYLHRKCMPHLPGPQDNESVAESLRFLTTQTKELRRWARNYIARADIRINLFYNLASQRDNRTNLDIANFTSKIAVDTQRDSSSMITIAAVTMFFLPGTFVSAVFSMVFFNSATDSSGRTIITTSPQLWNFFAITIPLTITVFLVWIFWRRWRDNVKGIGKTVPGSSSSSSYEEV